MPTADSAPASWLHAAGWQAANGTLASYADAWRPLHICACAHATQPTHPHPRPWLQPPELLMHGKLSTAADVYGFGVMLVEARAGREWRRWPGPALPRAWQSAVEPQLGALLLLPLRSWRPARAARWGCNPSEPPSVSTSAALLHLSWSADVVRRAGLERAEPRTDPACGQHRGAEAGAPGERAAGTAGMVRGGCVLVCVRGCVCFASVFVWVGGWGGVVRSVAELDAGTDVAVTCTHPICTSFRTFNKSLASLPTHLAPPTGCSCRAPCGAAWTPTRTSGHPFKL